MQLMSLPNRTTAFAVCFLVSSVMLMPGNAAPAAPRAIAEKPGTQALRTCTPARRTDAVFLKRRAEILARKKNGPIDLLFLGDSITQRWDGPLWEKYFGCWNPANFGIDGDRTQHLLWRVTEGKELDGLKPKAVVLLIGVNNVSYDPAADIAAGIEAILREVRARLPASKILLLGVFPAGEKPNVYRDRLRLVNLTIASLADGDRVRFLDFGEQFLEPDRTISRATMPDFLHLTPAGYTTFAEAILPTLRDMLQ